MSLGWAREREVEKGGAGPEGALAAAAPRASDAKRGGALTYAKRRREGQEGETGAETDERRGMRGRMRDGPGAVCG